MSDWQERITNETAPAIRAEHDLRYRIAASLIGSSTTWADLGCGNGVAAGNALGASRPERVVLADIDAGAVSRAAAGLPFDDVATVVGDLTDQRTLHALGDALKVASGGRVVTCFEVVEHLASFLPLLTWGTQMALEQDVTFLLSVPNDAFWAIQNPHHRTSWGEGAFEELRRLLPAEHTLLRQVALSGSAVLDWDADCVGYEVGLRAGGQATVATHFIAAFGPRHAEIPRIAHVVETDMLAQRRWERERESNLAIAQSALQEQERTIVEQREQLQANTHEFEAWRAYIHELERELGHPLSGVPQSAESQAATQAQEADQATERDERS